MAQNFFGTLTSPSLPLLDANFTALFDLRELFATPGYSAASPSLRLDSGSRLGINGAVPSAEGGITIGSGSPSEKNGIILNRGAVGAITATQSGIFCELNGIGGTAESLTLKFPTGLKIQNLAGTETFRIDSSGHVAAGVDNSQTNGTAAKRWSTVYAGTGTINTSDAREKTTVSPLTTAEVVAAQMLAREVGTYQWLAALQVKGAAARKHVGLTVQRVIEILASQGLDPMAYGFICYDQWLEEILPARTEQRDTGLKDSKGDPIYEVIVVEPEKVIPAGDRYSFRPDELLLFLARGFEARLSALEAAAA